MSRPAKKSKEVKESKEVKLPKTWLPEKECISAIGIEHADPKVRKFLVSEPSFTLLPRPVDKSSWLLAHDEAPQTFANFALQRGCRTKGLSKKEGKESKGKMSAVMMVNMTVSGRERKTKTIIKPDRQTIYLAPIGEFAEGSSPSLELLRQYAEIYFGLPVKLMAGFEVTENEEDGTTISCNPTAEYKGKEETKKAEKTLTWTISSRMNRGTKQFFTNDILDLLVEVLPDDAFCVMGITMTDLYPQDSWNYVLGIASPGQHTGIFSFARYSPSFNREEKSTTLTKGESIALTSDEKSELLMRSCRVAVHELFHLFGVEHCQFYNCVMLGANSVEEELEHPLQLCCVCSNKLLHCIPSTDLMIRYQSLLNFYGTLPPILRPSFKKDADWLEARIKHLSEK